MKSPFPGMDPYLEEHWRDVHHALLTYFRDELQSHLPNDLRARLEERVCVEPDVGDWRSIYPDVRVVEYPNRRSSESGGVAVAEEVAVDTYFVTSEEPATEGFIEIIDNSSGNRVVSVIELLSHSNKMGEGLTAYRRKQKELLGGHVSLVEIDLLRAGDWTMAARKDHIRRPRGATYHICVTRGWDINRHQIYACPISRPLPTISIPLREGDPEASINLQELIERCYRNGRYDDIDYRKEPSPPLTEADAAWINERLIAAGLRAAKPASP